MENSNYNTKVEKFGKNSAKATTSQFFGFLLDAFDLTMILSTAPVLAVVLLPPTTALLGAFTIILSYSLTIIFRPFGSAIFGHFGDKIGRKKDLIITILGLGLFSTLTSALPTYASVGILSFVLFVIIRIFVGTFAGGEYAAGHPFVMEWTPYKFRGIISGLVQGGFSFGALLAAAIVAIFTGYFGIAAIKAYAWRYLFLTTLIPVVIALVVRLTMSDTPAFNKLKKENKIKKQPFTDLFRKEHRKDFFQVMIYMTGMFFFAYSLFAFVPTILEHAPSVFPYGEADTIYTYSLGTAFAGALFFGYASQKIGRRKLTLIWAVLTLIVTVPMFYGAFYGAKTGNVPLTVISVLVIGFITQAPWGIIPVYLSERFQTNMRSSGVGFGYSSGIFIGGWFSIYVPLMHDYLFKSIDTPTNIWFSTAMLLMIGAVIVGVGMYLSPETLGTEITDDHNIKNIEETKENKSVSEN
ncbi:MFS transporter [Acidiplasma aeolicum]|uniref:MFS transporter n=1 Tax=Acidiplasma aeolicum TaxID=507754 RepID=A0A0P9CUG9_9ARCH|nr:MFS transporter [Acidiplasma aeolicum]KPV46592.1 MFS transporter [Acidiplasma aeolicum]